MNKCNVLIDYPIPISYNVYTSPNKYLIFVKFPKIIGVDNFLVNHYLIKE